MDISGGDTYAVTWPIITWFGGVPTLGARSLVTIWKFNTALCGQGGGDAV